MGAGGVEIIRRENGGRTQREDDGWGTGGEEGRDGGRERRGRSSGGGVFVFVVKAEAGLHRAGGPVGLWRLEDGRKKGEVEERGVLAGEEWVAAGGEAEFAAEGADRGPP